jgi:hypothetical protein
MGKTQKGRLCQRVIYTYVVRVVWSLMILRCILSDLERELNSVAIYRHVNNDVFALLRGHAVQGGSW